MKASYKGTQGLAGALLLTAALCGCPTSPSPGPTPDAGAAPSSVASAPMASVAPASSAAAAPANLPADDTVLISIPGESVTVGEFGRALRRLALTSPDGQPLPDLLVRTPNFQWTLARELLTLKIARKEARDRKLLPTPEEQRRVLEEMPGIAQLMKLTPEERRTQLEPRALDDTDLLEIASDRLILPRVQDAMVPDVESPAFQAHWRRTEERISLRYIAIPTTPNSQELDGFVTHQAAEIARVYKEHPERFTTPLMRRVSVIQRHMPPNAPPEVEARLRRDLEEVRFRVNDEKADFAALARQISDHPNGPEGGSLGWLLRAQLPEAFDAPIGRVSDIQRTPQGLRVFLVHEASEPRPRPLDIPLQREIAADMLRKRPPRPELLEEARALLKLWRAAGPEGSSDLQKRLEARGLALEETPGFHPSQNAMLPGIGEEPAIAALLSGLTPEQWLHDKPVVTERSIFLIGLASFKKATREEFERTVTGPVAEDMLREARSQVWEAFLNERMKDLEINLQPLQSIYGVMTKQDTAVLQRAAAEEEALKKRQEAEQKKLLEEQPDVDPTPPKP